MCFFWWCVPSSERQDAAWVRISQQLSLGLIPLHQVLKCVRYLHSNWGAWTITNTPNLLARFLVKLSLPAILLLNKGPDSVSVTPYLNLLCVVVSAIRWNRISTCKCLRQWIRQLGSIGHLSFPSGLNRCLALKRGGVLLYPPPSFPTLAVSTKGHFTCKTLWYFNWLMKCWFGWQSW